MNPSPGTVGNLARRIPDDLGRLVDRDYGRKNVDPGPPTGNCVEDIAKTIAWYEELVKAGFPTGDAEARLDEVLERCKKSPPTVGPPESEPYDPYCCCCKSGEWVGVIDFSSAGIILNYGSFSGTLTCKGEPSKKMHVSGPVWGLGFFAGFTGFNTANTTMFGECPANIQGTTQGGIISLGAGLGVAGGSVDFPMNGRPNGGNPLEVPSVNLPGLNYPHIGGAAPWRPQAPRLKRFGVGYNMSGLVVDKARCE